MLGAAKSGNQLILYPRPDIDLIVTDLVKKKPTFLPGVPTTLHRDQQAPQRCRGSTLGEINTKICLSWVAQRLPPVEVPIGIREADRRDLDPKATPASRTSPTGSINPMGERRPGSCGGVPIPGTVIEIRDMRKQGPRPACRARNACRRGLHHRPARS